MEYVYPKVCILVVTQRNTACLGDEIVIDGGDTLTLFLNIVSVDGSSRAPEGKVCSVVLASKETNLLFIKTP